MEHEEKIFFCFRPFVIAQELLEVTTKLPVKLNDPVINVGTLIVCVNSQRCPTYGSFWLPIALLLFSLSGSFFFN
jgi:hypothetical protein